MLLFLFVLKGLFCGSEIPSPSNFFKESKLLTTAKSSFDSKAFYQSKYLYQKYLSLNSYGPYTKNALYGLAVSNFHLEDRAAALEHFSQILLYYPDTIEAVYASFWIGLISFYNNEYENALTYIDEFYRQLNLDHVIEDKNYPLEKNIEEALVYAQVFSLYKLGKEEESFALLKREIKNIPSVESFWFFRYAKELFCLAKDWSSLKEFLSLCKTDSWNKTQVFEYKLSLALATLNLDGIKSAMKIFTEIESDYPLIESEEEASLFALMLDMLWNQNEDQFKQRVAKKIIEFDSNNCVAWFYLICVKEHEAFNKGRGGLEISSKLPATLVDKILAASQNEVVPYGDYILSTIAYEYFLKKQYQGCVSFCKKIHQLYPNSRFFLQTLYLHSLSLVLDNQTKEAYALLREDKKYQQALKSYPTNDNEVDATLHELIFLDGMSGFYLGDYFNAAACFSLLVSANEKTSRDLDIYYQLSNFFCDRLVKPQDNNYGLSDSLFLNFLEAISFYKVGEHSKVVEAFYRYTLRRYKETKAEFLYYPICYFGVYSLYQQKRWSEILELASRIEKWDQSNLEKDNIGFMKRALLEVAAWAALQNGNYTDAKKYFDICENRLLGSLIYSQSGKEESFKAALLELAKEGSLYGDLILFELAASEFRNKNLDGAKFHLEKLLEGYPSSKYLNEVKLLMFHIDQFLQTSAYTSNPENFILEAQKEFSKSDYLSELDYYKTFYLSSTVDALLNFLDGHKDFSKELVVLTTLIDKAFSEKNFEVASNYLRELQNRYPIAAVDFDVNAKLQFLFLLLQEDDLKEKELYDVVVKNSLSRRRGREAALSLANLFINIKMIEDEGHEIVKWLFQISSETEKYSSDAAKAYALLGDFYKHNGEHQRSYEAYFKAYQILPTSSQSDYYLFCAFMEANRSLDFPLAVNVLQILKDKNPSGFWLKQIYEHKFWSLVANGVWLNESSLRPTYPRGTVFDFWKEFVSEDYKIQNPKDFGKAILTDHLKLQSKELEHQPLIYNSSGNQNNLHSFDINFGVGTLASFNFALDWDYYSSDGLHSYVKFLHGNSHFWNYQPATSKGQGRNENFDFGIEWFDKKNQVGFDLSYGENQSWLQNKVDGAASATWRTLFLDLDYLYRINDNLIFNFFVGSKTFIHSYDYANTDGVKSFLPISVSLLYSGDFYKLDFKLSYQGAFKVGLTHNHLGEFLSSFDVTLTKGLNLIGNFGLLYDSDLDSAGYSQNLKGVALPFSLGLLAKPNSWFAFLASGGYKKNQPSEKFFQALKEESPFFEFVNIPTSYGWYFESQVDFFVKEALKLSLGLSYDKMGNNLSYDPTYIQSPNGLLKIKSGLEEQLVCYANLDYRYNEMVGLSFLYEGQLLGDKFFLSPKHLLNLSLDYLSQNKNFGTSFDLGLKAYDEFQIPIMDLAFFVEVKKGYRIWLKGQDLLSPIYKSGREMPFYFASEGLHVALLAQILL